MKKALTEDKLNELRKKYTGKYLISPGKRPKLDKDDLLPSIGKITTEKLEQILKGFYAYYGVGFHEILSIEQVGSDGSYLLRLTVNILYYEFENGVFTVENSKVYEMSNESEVSLLKKGFNIVKKDGLYQAIEFYEAKKRANNMKALEAFVNRAFE